MTSLKNWERSKKIYFNFVSVGINCFQFHIGKIIRIVQLNIHNTEIQ